MNIPSNFKELFQFDEFGVLQQELIEDKRYKTPLLELTNILNELSFGKYVDTDTYYYDNLTYSKNTNIISMELYIVINNTAIFKVKLAYSAEQDIFHNFKWYISGKNDYFTEELTIEKLYKEIVIQSLDKIKS